MKPLTLKVAGAKQVTKVDGIKVLLVRPAVRAQVMRRVVGDNPAEIKVAGARPAAIRVVGVNPATLTKALGVKPNPTTRMTMAQTAVMIPYRSKNCVLTVHAACG